MIAIRDRWGRPWAARLDVSAAVRLRDLADVDVMQLAIDSRASSELASDPASVAAAVYALFLPLAEQRGISPHRFGKRLRGFVRWAVRPSDLTADLLAEVREFFVVPKLSPGRPKVPTKSEPDANELWGLVWRLSALAGVEPGSHTFGELVSMADARRKHDWSQTASILGMLYAANCGKRKAKPASAFDPTGGLGGDESSVETVKVTRSTLRTVASIFLGR